jgi:hypothetical protein
MALPPIDPDTGSGSEDYGEQSEYEEHWDDGLGRADHNLNT